jgi:hypothetical protein
MSPQIKEKIRASRAYSARYSQLKVMIKVSGLNTYGMNSASLDTIQMSAGNFGSHTAAHFEYGFD